VHIESGFAPANPLLNQSYFQTMTTCEILDFQDNICFIMGKILIFTLQK
jgi:hypothetical protein